MYYEPYGPFSLRGFLDNGSRNWRAQFWSVVEKHEFGLSRAQGVYLFSLRRGDRHMPWYVGKTCSVGGFSQECFQDHKVRTYRNVTSENPGEPFLHLIALVESGRLNFCRPSKSADRYALRVETYLIEMCLARNPELMNDRKTKFVRELEISGVIGQEKYAGRRTNAARALRSALGL